MRRPFIDAAVLAGSSNLLPLSIRKGPAMSNDIRFALLPSLNQGAKIAGFPDLDSLARAIHRARDEQALDMNEIEDMEISTRPDATRGVEIYTMNDGHDRTGFVGYAYLDNQGLTALKAALRRTQVALRAEAA
ncbi:hypothetical protein [Brevundimonas sp.]|uniref:hypothetical protein n=1 Tax=Brevundimonas sp. TaxID=1871086 RepID=UPI00289FA1A1|nr:hypothetical protein [Brevundimonas sp.]